MDQRQQELTREYRRLLSRTGEERRWPTVDFHPHHEGGDHVQCNDDGSWSLVNSSRGHVHETRRYTDRHELLFTLCAAACWRAAREDVEASRDTHVDKLNNLLHGRQRELLERIDEDWSRRSQKEWATWTRSRNRQRQLDEVTGPRFHFPPWAEYVGFIVFALGMIYLVYLTRTWPEWPFADWFS
ncbi:MAG: hypothetical protein AAF358_13265 [Pseudomonadota bacterium]